MAESAYIITGTQTKLKLGNLMVLTTSGITSIKKKKLLINFRAILSGIFKDSNQFQKESQNSQNAKFHDYTLLRERRKKRYSRAIRPPFELMVERGL